MCTGCGAAKVSRPRAIVTAPVPEEPLIAPKSNSEKLVRLRYYGGGFTYRPSVGCRSCASKGKYALTTSETIRFASDDAPDGWFQQVFSAGHEYYVTEQQAKYLLMLSFMNRAGQKAYKFKEVKD